MNEESNSVGLSEKEALSNINKVFSKTIKRIRKEKNLTQHDLEDGSGLSLRIVGDLETGERQPMLKTPFKLAKGLGLSFPELIDEFVKDYYK